jgi:hypothetical protein
MEPSPKISDPSQITRRIERALEDEFTVVPLRLRGMLDEIRKALTLENERTKAPGGRIDGFILITEDGRDATGRTVVSVAAYPVDGGCQKHAREDVVVSDLKAAYDLPDPFFEDAAKELPYRGVEQVLIMPPVIGTGIHDDIRVERLRRQLADGILRTYHKRNRLSVNGDIPIPSVPMYGDGAPQPGAWQARLHLDRGSRQETDVRVEFRAPGSGAGAPGISGHFAEDVLSTSVDPPLLTVRAAQSPFPAGAQLDVRVKLQRQARLFCFMLTPDGRASLLYPTRRTLRWREGGNLFGPRDGEMKFPNDFFPRPTPEMPLPDALDQYFHCIATPQPPPEAATEQWLQNTVEARQEERQKGLGFRQNSVDSDLTRAILSELRQTEGRAEVPAEIVSVPRPRGESVEFPSARTR